MQLMESRDSEDYIVLAKTLAEKFAQTAVIRDAQGGTAKQERDRLISS